MRRRPPAQPCKMRARHGGPGNGTGSGLAPRAGTTTLRNGLLGPRGGRSVPARCFPRTIRGSCNIQGADGLSRPGASPGRSEGLATYKGRVSNPPGSGQRGRAGGAGGPLRAGAGFKPAPTHLRLPVTLLAVAPPHWSRGVREPGLPAGLPAAGGFPGAPYRSAPTPAGMHRAGRRGTDRIDQRPDQPAQSGPP